MIRPRLTALALLLTAGAIEAGALLPVAHAAPAVAMRHLRLVRSFPVKDTSLTSSPDAIRLWLSEPTESGISKIALASSNGLAVPLSAVTRDAAKDAPLETKIPKPLLAGVYVVTWKTMSKDGHVVNGTFGFRVVAPK